MLRDVDVFLLRHRRRAIVLIVRTTACAQRADAVAKEGSEPRRTGDVKACRGTRHDVHGEEGYVGGQVLG